MSLEPKKLFKSAGLYIFATIVNGAVPFLALPILTRHLTTVDFGHIAMFTVLTNVFAAVTSLCVHGTVSRFYFDREEISFPKIIGNSLYLLGISCVLGTSILYFSADLIFYLTQFPKDWLFAVAITGTFQTPLNIYLGLKRSQNKPVEFAKAQISNSVGQYGLALGLIIGLNYHWEGRIIGQLATLGAIGIFCLYSIHKAKLIEFTWDKDYIKKILSFGVPLIPHMLGGIIFANIDRLLLTKLHGLHYTGLYALAAQFTGIIDVLADSYNRAYTPWLFETLKKADLKTKWRLVKLTYTHLGIAFAFCLLFISIMPWVFSTIISKEFREAATYFNWLCLAGFFHAGYLMVANYVLYAKKTALLATATLASGFTNFALSYYFIEHYGPMGAARGAAAAQLFQFCLTWYLSSRVYDMPWTGFKSKS